MTAGDHDHLGLRGWPFNIVPSEETAAVWVGRTQLRRQLRALLRTASRVPASQIVLLWASFGQGKTHALRHLEGLARQEPDIIPLFTVTPKGIRSFVDIYRAIADGAIAANLLAAAGRDLFDRTGGRLHSDVERAVVRIAMYSEEEARVAVSWLRADKVPVRDLKDIGLSQRIETSGDAVEALNQLIRVLQRDGSVKVLLLIDEVQELADVGKRVTECIGGLHKVFDRNPTGLTMVLSFMTATQPAMKGIIGETLFDRASDVLSLPALDPEEAIELIEGLLREWSLDPATAPAPFTRDAIVAVVRRVASKLSTLTPRAVIKPFNKILRDADLDIADGEVEGIDEAYAIDHLSIEDEESE
jgi:hypothetical protein